MEPRSGPGTLATRRTDRAAALLLLVYPAVQAFFDAGQEFVYVFEALPLTLMFLAASAGLWFGFRWARGVSLALATLTGGVLAIFLSDSLGASEARFLTPAEPVLMAVSALAGAGAAFLLLAGDRARTDPGARYGRRRAHPAVTAFGIETALMLGIAVFGLGGMTRYWYQDLLSLTQLPGVTLLRWMGFCCGYSSSVVLSDFVDVHWGGLTLVGIPILGLANTIGLLPFVLLWRTLRERFARRTAETPASPIAIRPNGF